MFSDHCIRATIKIIQKNPSRWHWVTTNILYRLIPCDTEDETRLSSWSESKKKLEQKLNRYKFPATHTHIYWKHSKPS